MWDSNDSSRWNAPQPNRYCPACGTPLAAWATSCQVCGSPVLSNAQVAAAQSGSTPTVLRAFVALLVIVALAGGAVVWYTHMGPGVPRHTVTGTLLLIDTTSQYSPGIGVTGDSCYGIGGYEDLGPGAAVVLKDEKGTILATTSLGMGTGKRMACTFSFTLTDVTDGASFYSVEISHRGQITNSHEEMDSNGWRFALSIGR